jgi:hypothetical protein
MMNKLIKYDHKYCGVNPFQGLKGNTTASVELCSAGQTENNSVGQNPISVIER